MSPVPDRKKENEYGLISKKVPNSEKKDPSKMKRKSLQNGTNSTRKNKVKSKQSNYQPSSGKIDLVSRNARIITQPKNENSKE